MKTFFTPGPSQLYPGVDTFLADALANHVMSISHRSSDFSDIFSRTVDHLRALMDIPADYQVFFLGSATEAMERIVQNCAEKRTHHFVNGAFSEKFFTMAQELGKQATETRLSWGRGFTAADMKVPPGTELAAFTHNETSTGAVIDMQDIYAFKRAHPHVLVAVDVVSSAPLVHLDFAHLDCVFFSVQKAFGLPAGLGVLIVSPAAMDKARQVAAKISVGSYHSFASLAKSAAKFQTPATPNVLGMYLLGRVAGDMRAKGIDKLRENVTARAALLYELLETHDALQPFVAVPEHRSQTVIVAEVRDSHAIVQAMAEQGLIIGKGYKDYKGVQLRIANFPAVDNKRMEHLASALKRHQASPITALLPRPQS